ncbi:Golgi transport complex subunit 6 [Phlyctochytrium bullatum]|nr:Golgi transport complex subunit 6 [Phlyctochytrium bullatum]
MLPAQPLAACCSMAGRRVVVQAHAMRYNSTRFNFDTYKLVRQLERQGFSRGQSVAVMRTINALLVDSTLSVRGQMLSKTEVENEAYLYKTNLEELKNELQILRQNETGSLKAEVETIMRNLESLNQKLSERIAALKADVSMDLNNHKTEARDIGTTTDLKIQEIHHKLVIHISNLKTKMETIKMDLTRNIVWTALFAFAFILTAEFLTQPSTPSKKANNTLDDAASQEALKTIGEFYQDRPLSRKSLKTDIDQRITSLNYQLLDAYEYVLKNLDNVERTIVLLNESLAEMEDQLASANDKTADLMKQTTDMKQRALKIETRKAIAERFIHLFVPTDEEVSLLTSSSSNVGPEFFSALRRCLEISDDCKALLTTDNQRAGLEILEKISQYLEVAYEKLFRWANNECRHLSREVPDVSSGMKDALKALRQRPVLFQTCVDEICHIRQTAISRAFLEALTQGGPNGLPKPIEIHAHDPLRYIGDMSGWLHQTAVSERDLIEGIIGVKRGDKPEIKTVQSPIEISEDANEETLLVILDKNMERVCRPFRVRVEQVLAAQPGAITSYRVASTLQFYSFTLSKVIGPTSKLAETLQELTDMAFGNFYETLKEFAEKVRSSNETPGRELAPPPIVKETILTLRELMSSYEANIVESRNNSNNFEEVLSIVLTPVFELCVNGSNSLPLLEATIYKINCFSLVQMTLAPFSFATDRIVKVDAEIEKFRTDLVSETYSVLLQQSGLTGVVKALEKVDESQPMKFVEGLDQRSIAEAISRLDVFLRDINFDVTSRLSRLTSLHDTRVVIDKSLKRFVESYADLYGKVTDPKNKYEFPATLMSRSVEEIETLLLLPASR